jgi:hypothetical protein
MPLLYLGILVAFVLIVVISISNTRPKAKTKTVVIDPDPDLDPEEPEAKFDLYESIYDFMARQKQYLQALG